MASNIVVPELSESVVEATVADWLKNVGDSVSAGDVVVMLETDKVTLEVTAEVDGVIASINHEAGADVEAGAVLGTIEGSDSAPEPQPIKEGEAAQSETEAQASPTPAAAPSPSSEGQKATPVARRMAEEHNVDLKEVTPSGDKIKKGDVQQFIAGKSSKEGESAQKQTPAAKAPAAPAPTTNGTNGYRREERIRMSRRRQTIARRLVEAQQTAAMLTTFNEIDMKAVMDMRARRKEAFKEKHGVSLGFTSFFVKAAIGALKAFPRINGEIQDKEIVLKDYYDIGIAIGAEEGLVVPIIRDADRLSFAEIEQQVRDYAQASRDGTLSVEALMGGTFTITNGGVFGSMMSTPILNPPQVGILGLHAITDRPVVVDGEITIRPMMYVALTYDHRMVDGREAVQFLMRVKELIEDPETLLIEG